MNLFQRLVEQNLMCTVTSGDIAFVPSQMGVVGPKIRGLLKKKKSWKIKMTEDPIKEEYTMDLDGHGIKILKKHWNEFQNEMKQYGTIEKDGEERYFNVFSSLIAEATAEEMQVQLEEVKTALMTAIDSVPCSDAARALSFFGQIFAARYEGDNIAVVFNKDEQSISKLLEEIQIEYGDDRGAYEMLTASLEQKRSLKFSSVINEYRYLFGALATAMYKGVAIRFECYVDLNFVPHESLQILGAEDVVAELDGYQGIKSYGDILYPRSKHIPLTVFNRIKKEIV